MRTPDFWYAKPGLASTCLSPFAGLYDLAGRAVRRLRRPAEVPAFVVCVGNAVAGGAGKTPTALALAALIRERGLSVPERPDPSVAFLTRGYGGRGPRPLRVAPDRHTADEVGDEALLLARSAPVWVCGSDRAAGARAAIAEGARILVMDDGFQNRSLARDLDILVIDGATGFGNGHVMPAGPLRESAGAALARADAVVLIGEDSLGIRSGLRRDLPVYGATVAPSEETRRSLHGQRVLALAGIARPEKFFATLSAMGCEVVEARGFADHHPFTPDEIMRACEDAAARDAIPVTTEKDHVRLPSEARPMITPVPVSLIFDDPDGLAGLLTARMGLYA